MRARNLAYYTFHAFVQGKTSESRGGVGATDSVIGNLLDKRNKDIRKSSSSSYLKQITLSKRLEKIASIVAPRDFGLHFGLEVEWTTVQVRTLDLCHEIVTMFYNAW